MSIFYCEKCQLVRDGDHIDAVTDPNDNTKMCCLSCLEAEIEEMPLFRGTREALANLSIRGEK